MYIEIVIYVYNYLSIKEENPAIFDKMNEPGGHYAKQQTQK